MKKILMLLTSLIFILGTTTIALAFENNASEAYYMFEAQENSEALITKEITSQEFLEIQYKLQNTLETENISPRLAFGIVRISGTSNTVTVDCSALSTGTTKISGTVTIIIGNTPIIKSYSFYPQSGLYQNNETWTYSGWKSATLNTYTVVNNGESYISSGTTTITNS